jgi:hypothetical protein
MITLREINDMFPGEFRGSVYSDLHKDAYGYRPRAIACEFADMADFDRAWARAEADLYSEMDRKISEQHEAREQFEKRVAEILMIMPRASKADVIRVMMQAQNISEEDVAHYGLEYADYEFGLKYGTLAKMMEV